MDKTSDVKPVKPAKAPKAEAGQNKNEPERTLTVIEQMIKEINETTDKVVIDGRNYTTVSKRNEILRKHLGFDVQILTKHLNIDSDKVIFECHISVWKDGVWQLIATGHAEESRNSNEINKKSAVENAETSALGRALANLGLAGGEFASINELAVKTNLISRADDNTVNHVKALIKQSGMNEKAMLAAHNVKSFDMLKEEDAFKIIKKCLAAIESKKTGKPNDPKGEEEIHL